MKNMKTIMIIVLFISGLGGLHAQESVPASGGEASGVGGTSSYTVGQIVYTTNTGTNGSLAQGIQQPYEISVIIGIEVKSINLDLSVYPNPTKNYVVLNTENSDNISYQLFNVQGKLIKNNKVYENNTPIEMSELPNAIYFLKVSKNDEIVKTFKIIKN